MRQYTISKYYSNKKRQYFFYIYVTNDYVHEGYLSKKGKICKICTNLRSSRNAIRILKQNFKVKKTPVLYKGEPPTFRDAL